MKIRKVGAGRLKLEVSGGGKAAVQQAHEDVLRHFEGLILAAHLHEQLLGKDTLHQLPGMRRDLLQMPVYVHADQAAKAHARADEGRKAPPVRAVRQLDIVRPARREHRVFADDHAGFIGDLAAAHGIFCFHVTI